MIGYTKDNISFNYEKNGKKYIIYSVDSDTHLTINEKGRTWWINSDLLRDYTPIPHATPKRVKLQNVNGEDVWCDWKPTHIHDDDTESMNFIIGTGDHNQITCIEDYGQGCHSINCWDDAFASDFKPITPTHPITDKINAVIRKHDVTNSAMLGDIKDIIKDIEKEIPNERT